MDAGIVASQLQTHKIREGPIYKRTKFLQEWQQRWAVLTMNFLFVFTNRSLKQVTDYIDLRDVLSYKSYLRKDDDMIPAGFKLTTIEEMHYFCARNCNEKWSWMVSIERLMDFKYTGKSPYNNIEWISTKGFMSQGEYQRGKFDDRVDPNAAKEKVEKPKQAEKPKEKVEEKDLEKLKKELEDEKKRIAVKEEELLRKEKEQEQLFILELNKLKKAEETLKEIQAEIEHKAREAERIIAERAQEKPREIIIEKIVEKIIEKPVQVIVEKPVQVIVEKPVEVIAEKVVQVEKEKGQEPKKEQISEPTPIIAKRESAVGQKVSEMRKLYESKMDVGKYPQQQAKTTQNTQKEIKNKEETKNKEDFLFLCRDRVILNLFQEFHSKSYSYGGLRTIIEFLIKICSDRSLGYQQYFIRQAKAHENRFIFGEVFLELICNSKDHSSGRSLSKLVEVLIFEAPGIFKLNHFDIIKRKMADLFLHATDEGDVAVILKTMYVVHKVKKFDKDAAIHEKLKAVEASKSEEAKNWARKLLEDL